MKREPGMYKLSELKALAVFRELHELLERYPRGWYPTEVRERARTALRVLAQKTGGTRFAEPPNDGSNPRADSPQVQDNLTRAELEFAREKLFLAVRSAIRSQECLPQRLLACYLELHTLDFQRRLPSELQERFDAMTTALTREVDPTGRELAAAMTIQKMNDEEALKWIDEILSLLAEVIKRARTDAL